MRQMWCFAAVVAGCVGELDTTESSLSSPTIPIPLTDELVVANDQPTGGIFDPSILFATDGTGVMAYSAVPDQATIRTHIAVSSDRGATWTAINEANTPQFAILSSSDPVECPGGWCAGNLISETPSLVYDADDPNVLRRWKLFADRYLSGHYAFGTLTIQAAYSPLVNWTTIGAIGWRSSSPYSTTNITTNASYLPGMGDCLALTEPAALWLPGQLQLAVGCIYAQGTTALIRIELLRSFDHAATWQHVSTLLVPSDGGTSQINGADLFVSGGREYVIATAGDPLYHGCSVFPVDDIWGGHVRRDATGHAVSIRTFAAATGQFSGACTFSDATGYYLPAAFLESTVHRFRIFRTGIMSP